jgi:hypothetical protein
MWAEERQPHVDEDTEIKTAEGLGEASIPRIGKRKQSD